MISHAEEFVAQELFYVMSKHVICILLKGDSDIMVKKRIVIGSLLLLGMIGFGVAYWAVAKENGLSKDDGATIEVKGQVYNDSQGNHAAASQYEDSTENYLYEYESGNDAAEEIEVERFVYSDSQENHTGASQDEDSTENYFYEYEYEDDDSAEIKVERIDYTH